MPPSQHPTIKSGGQHLPQRPTPISEPRSNQWQQGCPQAATNTLGQVTAIPFILGPRGAGVSLGSTPGSVCLVPKPWKGTSHNKAYCSQSNSSAGFSCALRERNHAVLLSGVILCWYYKKITGNGTDISIPHSCCCQMWLTIFCCLF